MPTLAALTAFLAITSNGVARKDCFPVESLPAALRPRAEELLLKALDSEALYTFVGLKPMSSGWVSHRSKSTRRSWAPWSGTGRFCGR